MSEFTNGVRTMDVHSTFFAVKWHSKNITYQEMPNNSILGGWSSFLFLFFKHMQQQFKTTFQNKILKDNNYIYHRSLDQVHC